MVYKEKIRFFIIEEIKNISKPKILYLHGLDATPETDKISILKPLANIIAPKLNYNKPLFNHLSSIIESKDIKGIVGHSIGGYLAFYLSNKHKLPCLMFNPAFNDKDLKLQPISSKIKEIKPYNNQMAVIGVDDDVIPAEDQVKGLDNSSCEIYEVKAGHDIPGNIKVKYFKKFINSF